MQQDQDLIQRIAHYQPSVSAIGNVKGVPLLLAVGITAAGKDTVLSHLIKAHPNDYHFAISHTTRAPRENNGIMETNGSPYYFIDRPTALQMLDDGALVEANYYASNLYGLSIAEIERTKNEAKILVSDIDVNGIGNFVRLGLNAKPVFLLPPSFAVWKERLQKRYEGEFNKEDLRKRLQTALAELQNAIAHDYFYIVINDNLDETVELINDIAHGKPVERRHPKAVELAEELTHKIEAELAQL